MQVTTLAISPPNAPAFITRPAADRAGNSLAEFETGQPARDDLFDQRSERNAGAGTNLQLGDPDKVEAVAEPHDQAPDAQIAHQQIGPGAEAEDGNIMTMGQSPSPPSARIRSRP